MEKKVLADAYSCLARKKLSEFELTEKLTKKKHSIEEIEKWLPELRELGYLNDGEIVDSEIKRAMLNGHGPVKVAARLSTRLGIDFHAARQLVDEKYSESDQMQVASQVIAKKKPTREKLFYTLSSRGFADAALQHFLSADINN